MNISIFEFATKNKLRFPYKGLISVEDLWDLNQIQLDSVYKTLNKEVKQTQEESLMTKNAEDEVLQVKLDVVKHIFAVKQAEALNRAANAEKAEKKRRILEVLAQKQDNALMDKSEDELIKMLKEIEE